MQGDWRDSAACKNAAPGLFFGTSAVDVRQAKAVCYVCRCRRQCLQYAVSHGEKWGVWGGMSERERRSARRRIVLVAA